MGNIFRYNLKILLIFTIFVFFVNSSFGVYLNPKIELLYNKMISKIEKKHDLKGQQKILKSLKNKIKSLKNNKKYKNNHKALNLFEQLNYLNDQKLIKLEKTTILSMFNPDKSLDEIKKISQKGIDYERIHKLELSRRKKIIQSYDYSKLFKNKSFTKNNIFLENGVWKSYIFDKYSFFPEHSRITQRDLKYNGIDPNKALLFVTDNNNIGFAKNPRKINLINDDIIKDIKNKYYFLEEVLDDVKKSGVNSYDADFSKLKTQTEKITRNLSDYSKIRNIYNYILKNTSYSKKIDFNNYKIFSGIETFKNKDGVCEGYVKTMIYMLMFAGINDVEVIRGHVIDAPDFPNIGHAWVRIGDKYYDPTFDDPIGAISDKNFKDYKYFGLPRDLFYSNRYEYKNLPGYIKKLSLSKRKDIILKNLISLSDKYRDSDYKLIKLINFKKKYNIDYSEKITLDNFKKILPKKVVLDFSFFKNGQKKSITKLNFYNIDNFDLETLLEQLNYDLTGHYFFEWIDKNGKTTYRLAYDLEFK